jgi:hypothetical protein
MRAVKEGHEVVLFMQEREIIAIQSTMREVFACLHRGEFEARVGIDAEAAMVLLRDLKSALNDIGVSE